jgi:hypothetical protein
VLGIFKIGLRNYLPGLTSASWVAKIIGVRNWHLALWSLLIRTLTPSWGLTLMTLSKPN